MHDPRTLVIVGGGAAGFFCAVNAARMNPALRVIILEKSGKLLSKVKISGGGRCNVTHACFDIREMSQRYPRGQHFVKKAFHRFFTTDTIQWFAERNVQLKTEPDGRMFPVSDSSATIISCLLQEADRYRVEVRMQAEVKGIRQTGTGFLLELTGQPDLSADFICIASGGYPRSAMFDWLRTTGHTIVEPVPSLFTFNLPDHPLRTLMGISLSRVRIKITGTKLEQEGPLLITHWGLSGPAILALSARAARELAEKQYVFGIQVNWIPGTTEEELRSEFMQQRSSRASQKITGKNTFGLPARLWEFLALQSGVKADMRWADAPALVMNKLIRSLISMEIPVHGKTTFKEEFVTAGGIQLSEVDPLTMMSKKLPGLFFAGEVLDVDGITGGYNFQHAWTSGWIAAHQVASSPTG